MANRARAASKRRHYPLANATTAVTDTRPEDRIVRPEPADIRHVWPYEDRNFTPWLAANLDWLEEPLGLRGLELLETEAQIPGYHRYLDIVAKSADGSRIAIENQYRQIDHDHLTRGVAYALGHGCAALVVVAEGHGGEFVRIAEYLNEAYESLGPSKGIAVFLVTVKVQRVGENFVPRFECAARPNEWLAELQRVPTAEASSVLRGPGSMEEFLAKCSPEFRPVAERIVSDWLARPGATTGINRGSAAITLDYPYSTATKHRSVYVLYPSALGVNRGYYVESGAVDGHETEMDALLRSCFPDISDRPYYPQSRAPDPSQVTRFADWLTGVKAGEPRS